MWPNSETKFCWQVRDELLHLSGSEGIGSATRYWLTSLWVHLTQRKWGWTKQTNIRKNEWNVFLNTKRVFKNILPSLCDSRKIWPSEWDEKCVQFFQELLWFHFLYQIIFCRYLRPKLVRRDCPLALKEQSAVPSSVQQSVSVTVWENTERFRGIEFNTCWHQGHIVGHMITLWTGHTLNFSTVSCKTVYK